jgi:hypothetical protein
MSSNLTMASDLLPLLGPNERGQNRLSDASCLHGAVHSVGSADLEWPVPVAGENVGRSELAGIRKDLWLSDLRKDSQTVAPLAPQNLHSPSLFGCDGP